MSIKKDIYKAFTPPEPKDRDAFLSGISFPKLSFLQFVFAQTAYIRKRIWALSAAVLLAGICAVCFVPDVILEYDKLAGVWIVSSILPFLAMLTAAEISRSDVYAMSEIETGCRFGIAQLVTARLLILGVCNFAVVSAVTVVSGIFSPLGILRAALYILAPFSAVSGISLAVLRRFRGQEGIYISAGAALIISVLVNVFSSSAIDLIGNAMIVLSAVTLAAGAAVSAVCIRKIYIGDRNYGINY